MSNHQLIDHNGGLRKPHLQRVGGRRPNSLIEGREQIIQ